jgi:hypothetical protein
LPTSGGKVIKRTKTGAAAECLIAPAILVPLSILLHELGHFAVARALGFDNAKLHYSAVDPGPNPGAPAWMSGAVGLAGPIVTIALVALAIIAHGRRRDSVWPFALAIAAASRFAVGLPYSIVNLVMRFQGHRLSPPAFDEYKAATALGWSGDLLLAITSAIPLAVLVWLGLTLPRGRRILFFGALLLGTAVGWYLWMGLLGPRLLA